jgi:hypothetical protein
LLQEAPIDDWQTYLRWHLVNTYADKLRDPFVEEDFHFQGKVGDWGWGVKETRLLQESSQARPEHDDHAAVDPGDCVGRPCGAVVTR